MADINIKGRYRLYTHDGTSPFDFTTYANNLCVIRRPNENTFVTVRQYVPGPGAKPFTTFEPGSSYTISTKTNDSVFSMGPYTRSDRLPSSTTIKSPIFYIGLDRNSIPVPLSSYTLGANSPLSTIRTTEANLNGFYTNFTTFDANSYKIGFNQGFTHLQPGSSYELRNRVPFTLFAPLKSEMGDVYAMGNNQNGQFGLGHLLTYSIPLYRESSFTGTISAENIYGNWVKIIEYAGSVLALSACGTKKKLFACGRNDYGQLGLGYTSPLSAPVTVFNYVPHPTNNDYGWIDIAAGLHSLAVDEWGELYSCGRNNYGQLGLGDSGLGTNRNIFTHVNTNFQPGINPVEIDPPSIFVGVYHSLVRDQNGDLWSCGDNQYGQLGLGDTNQRNDFTLVGNIGYQDIGAGAYCSAYLSNNRMYACGRNYFSYPAVTSFFRIGVSNTAENNFYTTFTQEICGFSDIQNLWVGLRGIFVRRSSSNVLWACGANQWGNLGMFSVQSQLPGSDHRYALDKRSLEPTLISSNNIYNVIPAPGWMPIYNFTPGILNSYDSGSSLTRPYPYWIDSQTLQLKTLVLANSPIPAEPGFTPYEKNTDITGKSINFYSSYTTTLFHNRSLPPSPTPTPTITLTPTPTITPTPASPGKFVFVPGSNSTGNPTNTIYFSNDGILWTSQTISITDSLRSMAYDAINNRMIIQGTTNTSISVDGGSTWANGGNVNLSHQIRDIVYGNAVYSGVGGTSTVGPFGTYSSNNGTTWTTTNLPFPGSTSRQWNSITFGQGKFVAVSAGRAATRTNVGGYSTDGVNWTASTMPFTEWYIMTKYANNRFIATSYTVNPNGNGISYSSDGINWSASTRPSTTVFTLPRSIAFSNNRWIVLASQMEAAYSDDNGVTFTLIPSSKVTNLFTGSVDAFTAGKGKFVLMVTGAPEAGYTNNNQILISTDGLNWSHYQANFKTGGGKLYFIETI